MPETIITNAAHTALRRSVFKAHGIFVSGHRVPGTTFWRIFLSNAILMEILLHQRGSESLSDTIVKMFTLYDRIRKPHGPPSTSTSH